MYDQSYYPQHFAKKHLHFAKYDIGIRGTLPVCTRERCGYVLLGEKVRAEHSN